MDQELESKVRERLARMADDAGAPSPDLRRRVLREAADRRRLRFVLVPAAALATVAALVLAALVVQRDGNDVVTVTPAPSVEAGAWRTLPEAPIAPREEMVAVWTGTEMIVWGGRDDEQDFDDGAAFNPKTNEWRPLPAAPIAGRHGAAGVWTGDRVVVWGGVEGGFGNAEESPLNDGAVLDPKSSEWRTLPKAPISGGRPQAVFASGEVIVAAGISAATYVIGEDRWRPVAAAPLRRISRLVPSGDGRQLLAVATDPDASISGSAVYDPIDGDWTKAADPPTPGMLDLVAVDGGAVIVGSGAPGSVLTSRWIPDRGAWSPLGTHALPESAVLWVFAGDIYGFGGKSFVVIDVASGAVTHLTPPDVSSSSHGMVFTGEEILIWGGAQESGAFLDGGRAYTPKPFGGDTAQPQPTTTTTGEDEGPGTGSENACAGDFSGRGEEGVRAFVDAFYSTRVRGATGVDDCITQEMRQQFPGIENRCEVCFKLPLLRVSIEQADANSWAVTVSVEKDCDAASCNPIRTEVIFVGPGKNVQGEQRSFVVRGLEAVSG
ncbi:MAG TPA: hypothetical protein VMY34_05055 [Acidimicrobiales bacterium]|nr:hypothetical protein [Acidimicrobiales bacterium]